MTIRIENDSASAFVRGYAYTEDGLLVWLELPPQHPKLTGAIWASLVNGHRTYLQLKDEDKGLGKPVYGLGRAYTRLEMDAPELAVGHGAGAKTGACAKMLRLIAPEANINEKLDLAAPFYIFQWGETAPATVLGAALERSAPYPIRITWGGYLLQAAVERGSAIPLISGGTAPAGYEIAPTDWMSMIREATQKGNILL